MDKFYVMIATAGGAERLPRTLDSLCRCEQPAEFQETIVVENGPHRYAESLVERYRAPLRARYLHVRRANKSNALNEALATVEDGLVFFTDDDVRFAHQTLTSYADAARTLDSGEFYGGPTGADYEIEPPGYLLPYLPASARSWSLGNELRNLSPRYRRHFLGANWAAFSSDIKRLGGFNPHFGPGSPSNSTGQESEMQVRLLGAGLRRRYVPGAMVWHYVPREAVGDEWIVRRAYRFGIETGMLIGREPRPQRWWRLMKIWVKWLLARALPPCSGRARDLRIRHTSAFGKGVREGMNYASDLQGTAGN